MTRLSTSSSTTARGRTGRKFFGGIAATLGPDFVVIPNKSLLVWERHGQHDTIRARLFGARLVVGGETEGCDRLDEAKVKELTGGDL